MGVGLPPGNRPLCLYRPHPFFYWFPQGLRLYIAALVKRAILWIGKGHYPPTTLWRAMSDAGGPFLDRGVAAKGSPRITNTINAVPL